jgi:MFS family permease
VVSETWLNLVASERDRGRVMGIYATVMALGFAIGPSLIGLVGIEGWTPFLLIVLAMLLSASPLPFSRGLAPAMPAHQEVPLARLVRAQPLVMACAVLGGVADLALFSLLPVYGLRHGLDQSEALIAVSVFVGGNVLLQIPIGWTADHVSRRVTLLSCILVTILGTLLLPIAVGHGFWLYVLVFFLGGSTFSTYTLGLGLLGDGFPLAQLAAANVAFVMAYQVGSAGGPILAGTAMDVFGPEGLAGVVVTSAVILLALFFGLAPKR